jgi:PAS domain S-box-containing protein
LSELVASEHVAAVITDPRQDDNPIVECNARFLDLTGYRRDEVIGRNCRFLAGSGTDPKRRRILGDAVAEARPVVVELLNYRKDGSPFLNSVMIAPIFEAGELVGFVGSQLEVTHEETTFVKQREERARALVAALTPRQKEVLTALARGKRAKQIAHELEVTVRTVKMHRAGLLKALDVQTNAEAIRIAVRAGL